MAAGLVQAELRRLLFVAEKPATLQLPSDTDTLYFVRMFNGSLFPEQEPLITAMPDGVLQNRLALRWNAIVLAVQFVGPLIPTVLGDAPVAEILVKVLLQMELQMNRAQEA